MTWISVIDHLALKMGPIRLSRNVANYHSTLRNVPEERRSQTQSPTVPGVSYTQSRSQCRSPAYSGITSRSASNDTDDGRGYQLPAYCHIPLLPPLTHVKQPTVLVAVPKDTAWLSVDCVWNVMAHAQKPDFVFRRNASI